MANAIDLFDSNSSSMSESKFATEWSYKELRYNEPYLLVYPVCTDGSSPEYGLAKQGVITLARMDEQTGYLGSYYPYIHNRDIVDRLAPVPRDKLYSRLVVVDFVTDLKESLGAQLLRVVNEYAYKNAVHDMIFGYPKPKYDHDCNPKPFDQVWVHRVLDSTLENELVLLHRRDYSAGCFTIKLGRDKAIHINWYPDRPPVDLYKEYRLKGSVELSVWNFQVKELKKPLQEFLSWWLTF